MKNYKEFLKSEQKKYITQWKNNSQYYYDEGYYEWMNSHISKRKLILEIGCGNGLSTLTLLENGHQVIAIDENIECLKTTKTLLEKNNYKAKIIKREGNFKEDKSGYEYNYLKIKNQIEANQVLLIQGDILDDSNLEMWLDKANVDCVVCWLIGTHGARIFNKKIAKRNLQTPTDYRMTVEEKVCNMCNRILKSEGNLHLVDRVGTPKTEEDRNFYLQEYNKKISTTSLSIIKSDFKKFQSDANAGMTLIGNMDNTIADNTVDISFISVLFKKL